MTTKLTASQSFSAKTVLTADLLAGLIHGFNVTFYHEVAVKELIERGKEQSVRIAYRHTSSKMAKTAIRREFEKRGLSL